MLQALFYKEWCKTKRIIYILALLFAGIVIYTFIDTDQIFRISGATSVWSNTIMKSMSIVPQTLMWIPTIAGLLLACSQFIPEMIEKRFKLTLHLPMSENKIVFISLLYGIIVLLLLYVITFIALIIGSNIYYPSEIVHLMICQIAPWFVAGIAVYILSTWVILEPTWKQRIFNILISLCSLSLLYIDARPGAYDYFMPYIVITTLISLSFAFYSAARFKDGAQ